MVAMLHLIAGAKGGHGCKGRRNHRHAEGEEGGIKAGSDCRGSWRRLGGRRLRDIKTA